MKISKFTSKTVFFLTLCVLSPSLSSATTFTVDKTSDTIDADPGNGICADSANGCSLRAAIMEANAWEGDDSINVPDGTYTLSIAGTGEDLSSTGDLDLTSSAQPLLPVHPPQELLLTPIQSTESCTLSAEQT